MRARERCGARARARARACLAWRARVHGLERTVVAAVGLGSGCLDLGPGPRLVLAADVVRHQGKTPQAAAVVGLGEGAGLRGRAEDGGRQEECEGNEGLHDAQERTGRGANASGHACLDPCLVNLHLVANAPWQRLSRQRKARSRTLIQLADCVIGCLE